MMKKLQKRIISTFLAVLIAISGIVPAMSAFAADGVEGYYKLEIFYADTNTIVPTYAEDGESEYHEYMVEGDELQLTYKLIDSSWPNNGSVKWYSDAPALVDVTQDGKVKAFDSSKGAVIHAWIDNEVKTIPIVGSAIASVIEKALFNEYVNVDTLDTEAIVSIVTAALGSDSFIADYIEAYQGQLIDSLREYLDNINSIIHCELYDGSGTKVAEDQVRIDVLRNDEWYANFLPNGTHITNKSQIDTTQAKGATVQLYAITTPQRLNFGTQYSVKSTSIFSTGRSVATVTDGGLVTFRNTGTVTILASPDSEQVIQKILEMVNYFYKLENTGTLNTDKIADVLIKYMGIDINRAVLAGILDAAFAIYKVAGDAADPVQLTATAVEVLANIILQMAYNDSITFTVVDSQPITDFKLGGMATVKEGAQTQLTIEDMQPSTGDKSDLVWESMDPSIASVDQNGIVTGLDAGGSLGQLSSQEVQIACTSTTNNIRREMTVTVTGKTGKYISGVTINGPDIVELDKTHTYGYSIYPARVAEADNLYITWGMVTGKDEDGEPIYTWADKDNEAVGELAKINYKGEFTTMKGGTSTVAVMAKTGYYLSNGEFFEISKKIVTKDITTGIPVENINIKVTGGTGVGDKSIDSDKIVTINGTQYEYATAQIGVATAYDGKGAAFSASVYPNTATNQNLKWVIDNTNVYQLEDLASDTHSVKVKQRAAREYADTFNVYAVSEDGRVKSNVITVCVTRNMATGNKIDASKVDMLNGKTQDLTHTMSFDGSWTGGAYACYKCNWYSSDENIVSVSQKGNDNGDAVLKANDVGTATIYCVSADGAFVDKVDVTVRPDKTYLKEIIDLCDKTIVRQTKDNEPDYKKYMRKLDLAYTIYYEEDMAAQLTCDTYARELLYAFIRVGGFVGITDVEILGTNKTKLDSDFVSVKVSSTKSYKSYSYDFDYAVHPAKAMYSNVQWTSSNNSIVVDKNGRCTPANNAACCADITCTITDYNGTVVSNTKTVAFARTKATGVTVDPEEIIGAKIGEQRQLRATVQPTNALGNSNASVTDVKWYSSNEEVATVDNNGVVTFLYGGNTMIHCVTQDGGFEALTYINVVTNYDALQLLVNQYTDLSLNRINYYPETWSVYINAMTKAKNLLSSRNSTQEEVDAMYAELEAAYNGLKKYVYINNVELYLDGEATSDFYQYDLSLLKEGVSYKNAKLNLKVRLYPNNASYKEVRWESESEDISVTNEGVASPTSNKSCYGRINCTVYDHYGNAFSDTVWVSFSYRPVTGVVLSDDAINGAVGTTYQLSCTVEPVGTGLFHVGAADIQDYYWESDDDNIATVDNTGNVTFVSAGSTIVRCVSYDGGHKGECKVSTDGDRTALSEAIEKYKDVDYTKYEYSYAMTFKDAYEKAQKALTNNTLNQAQIDKITSDLNAAGEALASHPNIEVKSISVSYTTSKRSTALSSWNDITSGTISGLDALSVNLSLGGYDGTNSNNRVILNAGVSPANAMYKTIAWKVDENYQMDINNNGTTLTVQPSKNDGAYAIVSVTVTDHFDKTTTRQIYVTMADNVLTGFSINNQTSITAYATADAHTIDYSLGGSPRFTKVFFKSSDNNVATVDENGVIRFVDKGNATITAKTLDGGIERYVYVTVNADFRQLAEKVSEYQRFIGNIQDDLVYTEESLSTLQQAVSDSDALVKDGKATQAEINSQLEVLVSAYNGLEKYVTAQNVHVVLGEDGSAATEINPGFIRFKGTQINGKTVQLAFTTEPENAHYKSIEWVTDKPNTITVDDTGLVANTSATAGVAKISCILTNVHDQKFESSVYVSFVRNEVKAIKYEKDLIYGAPGEKKSVKPTIEHSGNISFVSDCIYKSSNTDVATVDEDGEVTFKTQGESTITAIALDGGLTATIKVQTTWDTGALQAAINLAKEIDYMDYEYSYGKAFKAAYDNAVSVYENPLALQTVIDEACVKLTEAMTNLEGHEFITPKLTLYANGKAVEDNEAYEVDSKGVVNITFDLNEGAMYKDVKLSTESEGIKVVNTADGLTITRNAAIDTPVVIHTVVTDTYDREIVKDIHITVVDEIINITEIQLFADGALIGSTLNKTCKSYQEDFHGIQLSYMALPTNATAPKSVTWTSSATDYITVSPTGFVDLTTRGKLRSTNTANITCIVTNTDGTKVTKVVTITISRS